MIRLDFILKLQICKILEVSPKELSAFVKIDENDKRKFHLSKRAQHVFEGKQFASSLKSFTSHVLLLNRSFINLDLLLHQRQQESLNSRVFVAGKRIIRFND